MPWAVLRAWQMKLGYHTNAAAGLALSLARPGDPSGGIAPGEGATLSEDGRRAVRMHLPLARRWKELYISWNLAFTHAYSDPLTRLGAPLLAPCVLGAPPAEFMFHRVFALHVHISLFVIRRANAVRASGPHASAPATAASAAVGGDAVADAPPAAGGGGPAAPNCIQQADAAAYLMRGSDAERRRRALTLLWGDLNMRAAQRYERRLRLLPLVAAARIGMQSGMAVRRVPYPISLILPPSRTAASGADLASFARGRAGSLEGAADGPLRRSASARRQRATAELQPWHLLAVMGTGAALTAAPALAAITILPTIAL